MGNCSCCQGSASQREEAPGDAPAHLGEENGEQHPAEDSGEQHSLQEAIMMESPLVAQRGTPFADFLEKGHMAVVRATYFDECLAAGTPFKDRANIPREAFIDGKEVVELWEAFGYAFLVIISYAWLARGHPDPQCYHLPRLVNALKAFRAHHDQYSWHGEKKKRERVRELGGGVILDFCAFWQGKSRTAEQTRIFKEGLKLINIPYGHRDVTVLKLTSTPASQARRYDDRGWTHFECTVIDGKAPSARSVSGEGNVLTCDDDLEPEGDMGVLINSSRAKRKPPLTPLRFREELEARRLRAQAKGEPLFTNSQDSPIVLERYDASFEELCRSTGLDYYQMGWGAVEAKELALALPYFGCLQTLRLSRNRLDGEATGALAAALPKCPVLRELWLRDTSLGREAAEALAATLPSCPSLSELYLKGNNLGSDGETFAPLAAALGRCRNLERLELEHNELGPEAAKALAAALPHCPALSTLLLDGNNLGSDGEAFAALATALGHCRALELLGLQFNKLGPEAAKALAVALPHCPALRELALKWNHLGSDGEAFAALAAALGRCQTLERLGLEQNELGPEDAKALAVAMPHCPVLRELALKWNNLGSDEEAFATLAAALGRCRALERLGLEENELGPEAAKALAAAVPQCHKLRDLRLRGNNLDGDGKAALGPAWRAAGKSEGHLSM